MFATSTPQTVANLGKTVGKNTQKFATNSRNMDWKNSTRIMVVPKSVSFITQWRALNQWRVKLVRDQNANSITSMVPRKRKLWLEIWMDKLPLITMVLKMLTILRTIKRKPQKMSRFFSYQNNRGRLLWKEWLSKWKK